MKRVLILLLTLAMCFSLCACGERDVASPGGADDKTAETNKDATVDNTSDDEAETNNDGEASENNNAQSNGVQTEEPIVEKEQNYDVGNLDMDITYSSDMTTTEKPEEKTVIIEHGANNRLYIQDVTGVYNPDTTDPSSFLYDYAYENCVQLVNSMFGQVIDFKGEEALATSGDELYAYGAQMTCAHNTEVYAYIKLVAVENGYAVVTGVCEKAEMNVFDNVDIG